MTSAADTVWLCAKCGHGSEEHGMSGHRAYECIADMRLARGRHLPNDDAAVERVVTLAQRRALVAVRDGQIAYIHRDDGLLGGGWTIWCGSHLEVARLVRLGLARRGARLGGFVGIVLTDAGREALA